MVMKLSQLRVRTRLMLGFAVLAGIVLLVSALAMQSLSRSNARFSSYLDGAAQRERMAVDIRSAANRRAISARNLVLVSSPADREVEKAAVTKAHEDVQASIKLLSTAMAAAADVTETDRKLVAEIEQIEARYGPVALEIVGMALQDRQAMAITKMNAECRPLLAALMKATHDLVTYEQAQAKVRVEAAAAAFMNDRITFILVSLAAAAAAMARRRTALSAFTPGAVTAWHWRR